MTKTSQSQQGFSFIETVLLLPLILSLFGFLLLIPLLHMNQWNKTLAEEEYHICLNQTKLTQCELRKHQWIQKLKLIK
jgi:competence protein ComGC